MAFLATDQLDVAQLRENLKTYLKSQTRFRDYDFEGSNIAVLLDVMSYNTFLNAWYLNQIGSEMFLDTAQLRDSIVSRAKELNYIPRSYRSAKATVQLTVDVSNSAINYVTVPRFQRFTAQAGNSTFNFTSNDAVVINKDANGNFIGNIDIYEGTTLTEKFLVNGTAGADNYITFTISNPKIDTTSLVVSVKEDANSSNSVEYDQAVSLLGINSTSTVYFLQGGSNSKYDLVFGDGRIGVNLNNGNEISAYYRISSGQLPNGANTFTIASNIDGYNTTVSTVAVAAGGAESESIESIRYNAPRHFQTQERAITPSDYETLILSNFGYCRSVAAFGGEELIDAPHFGKIFISIVKDDGAALLSGEKRDITNFVKLRNPVSFEVEVIEPEYINIIINSDINYDTNIVSVSSGELCELVRTSLQTYNDDFLDAFGRDLRYSRIVRNIDDVNTAIISNNTRLMMYKTYVPDTGIDSVFAVNFGNAFMYEADDINVYSSVFTYNGEDAYFVDNGGVLEIHRKVSSSTLADVLNASAGTIDYTRGIIRVAGVKFDDFEGSGINFYAVSLNSDIFSFQNNVIRFDLNNSTITAVPQ
jgi:hypothetical protein